MQRSVIFVLVVDLDRAFFRPHNGEIHGEGAQKNPINVR